MSEREQFAKDIMSLTAEQFIEVSLVTNFIFSLPEQQQQKAVDLYVSGLCISDIINRLEVAA